MVSGTLGWLLLCSLALGAPSSFLRWLDFFSFIVEREAPTIPLLVVVLELVQLLIFLLLFEHLELSGHVGGAVT